ncbi:MAG TPA: hypothetical protein VF950_04975 [Planctomycetota bacterium]
MGLPREDLLLLTRALKRGTLDLKGIRKALDRRASKPISLLEALHAPDAPSLLRETWTPDPAADRALLDSLRDLLLETGELKAFEWDKFLASLSGKGHRVEYPPLAVPMEFEGYTLQWEVARRERGVVYRAKDRDGRDVAIKVFRKDIDAPGLPRVEGLAYAAAPFEEGETLEMKGKHGLKWAVRAVAKAADALRATKHGALTPWRIVVRSNETVAVLGGEHAKAVAPSARAAQYGPGDDVRALGAILHEAITGVPPSGVSSPADRDKDVDPALDRVVTAALAGAYASTGALADDLWRQLNGQPVTAKPTARAAIAKAGGSRAWIWAAAAGVAVAAVATWLATSSPSPKPGAPEEKVATPAAPVKAAEPPKKAVDAPRPPAPAVALDRPMTPDEDRALENACIVASGSTGSKDVERVIAAANEAVHRGTKKDWPYSYLVRGYTKLDQLDKALEYATRATKGWPDNPDFLRLRAETFAFRGQAQSALADFQRLHGDRKDELVRELNELDSTSPKDGQTRLLLGVYHYLRRHFDTAAREFTQAIELGQKRAVAWRAFAYAGLEYKPEAIRDAKAYLAEFPSDFATDEVKALLKTLE